MAERSVVVRIRAEIGEYRKQMQEASKVTQEVGKTATETAAKSTGALGQMVQSAQRHEEAWSKSGGALLGFGAAVSVGVGLAIKSYMEFDKAMSEVKAATHASAGDMELLREAAIRAGADTSYSAREAADAITELSKAGVSTKEILAGGLDGALSLAAAGSLEVADAAELAATAMVQFKLKGDQIPHLADLLAAGAGKAQGSVEDLGMALKQGGLIAASTGLSIEETTGGLAAFASAGLLGSDAGTSFKTMLMSLTPNSAAAATEMEKLGINAYDQQGKFIGLSKFAGVLQTSMKGLTDEQRNASMKIIFGSDAVRAANVLYEQGAKGIEDWTAKVNDSGYAASTAAIKQDNLAGDIEKLGGSLDSVFLKSGSGANEVLRTLAQTAESLIDAVGGIPGPLLQTTLGLAATTGGAALLGGAFLTTFPKVLETKRAFDELRTSSPKLADGLGKVSKAAAVAAGALVALQIAGAISKSWDGDKKTVEDYAQAFLTLGKSTDDIDAVVKVTGGLGTQINGVGDALVRVNEFDWYDNLNNWAGDMVGGTSNTQKFRDSVKGLDNTLVGLVQNGGSKKAGESFKILSDEANKSAEAQGKSRLSAEQMLKLLPQYTEELKKQGTALGLKLTNEELHDLALGKIPARMEEITRTTEGAAAAEAYQAKMSEEVAKQLEAVGLAADGSVTDIGNFTAALFNAGLLSLSASDAAIAYQAAIDKVTESIITNGTTLDINTEQGRANQSSYNGLAKAAMATAEATATETLATQGSTAAQAQLQTSLRTSYDDLIAAAGQFGITGDAADTMARKALGIPKEVPIDTWVNDKASSTLDGIKGKADALDQTVVDIYAYTHDITLKKTIEDPGGMGSSIGGRDNGSLRGGAATGGRVADLMGFAGGGKVPGRAPSDLSKDNILAMVNGKPFGLQSEEWVINGRSSKMYDTELAMINAGTFPKYAPSKSMAGGYGQDHAFSGFGGGSSAPITVSAPAGPDVLVFIGNERIDARIEYVAANVVAGADGQSRFKRAGRQG